VTASNQAAPTTVTPTPVAIARAAASGSDGLPTDTDGLSAEDKAAGWVRLHARTRPVSDDFVIVSACNMPFLGRDCCMAPYARFTDGTIDLVLIDKSVGKADLVKALLDLEKGEHVHMSGGALHYIKCKRLRMDAKEGLLMCDGEVIPQAPVEIEVMPGAMQFVRTPAPHGGRML
jgi:diacylglycerol kinase family enzyme